MFAIIDTNGANRIAIHIPHQGSEKTLPALAAMLEQNATFIRKDWRSAEVVKPEMTIVLGNTFKTEGDSETPEIAVCESSAVIGDDFVNYSPEVRISHAKVIDAKNKEIERLRIELSATKMERDQIKDQLTAVIQAE